MEIEIEPNVYEQYEEYVKQVEVKQSDDTSLKFMMKRMLM